MKGSGSIIGNTIILNKGILSPGSTSGTLTVGNLELQSDSILEYELMTPGVKGGADNDFVFVDGILTLAGKLRLLSIGGEGVYHLMDYTGALTNNGITVTQVPNGVNPGNFLLNTSIVGEIRLIYDVSLPPIDPEDPEDPVVANTQYWDGSNSSANGKIDGGSGIWSIGGTNWTNSQGSINAPWASQRAVFRGISGQIQPGLCIRVSKWWC